MIWVQSIFRLQAHPKQFWGLVFKPQNVLAVLGLAARPYINQ